MKIVLDRQKLVGVRMWEKGAEASAIKAGAKAGAKGGFKVGYKGGPRPS